MWHLLFKCSRNRYNNIIWAKLQAFFIFDAYGEYHSAFKDLGKVVPEISFKTYTTNLKFPKEEVLKIPLWLLTTDDIALLLGPKNIHNFQLLRKH